jgi:hypothetical protein
MKASDGKDKKSSYRSSDNQDDNFVKDTLLLEYAYVKATKEIVKNQYYKNVDGSYVADGEAVTVSVKQDKDSTKILDYLDSTQIYNFVDLKNSFKTTYKTQKYTKTSKYKSDTYVSTYAYNIVDLTSMKDILKDYDGIYVQTNRQNIEHMESPYYYFDYSDSNLDDESLIFDDGYRGRYFQPMHYNVGFFNAYNNEEGEAKVPNRIAIKMPDSIGGSINVHIYPFKYEIYNNFIERQNQYTNRDYYLDGSNMHIEFDNNNSNALIVKTAYTYSNDWKVVDNKYETCNVDGGFLGIIIPKDNVGRINIDLKFVPAGFNMGMKLSSLGILLFFITTAGIIIYGINQKKKYNNLFN